MGQTTGLFHYLEAHWPMLGIVLSGVLTMGLWLKRKVLNDVFFTKEEARVMQDTLEAKIDIVNSKGAERHDELKTLIITFLGKDHGS